MLAVLPNNKAGKISTSDNIVGEAVAPQGFLQNYKWEPGYFVCAYICDGEVVDKITIKVGTSQTLLQIEMHECPPPESDDCFVRASRAT